MRDDEGAKSPGPGSEALGNTLNVSGPPGLPPVGAAPPASPEDDPEDVFHREFVEPRARSERPDLEEIIRRHPHLEKGLRFLHAFHEDLPKKGELVEGSFVAHFEIRGKLGHGTFSNVFLARQRDPVKRLVALKVLRPERLDRTARARFERECQVLMLLEHPGIARFWESGTAEDGSPFVAMEYVPGATLLEHCNGRELPLRDRIGLFLQLCDAVAHAHQRTIIHRDLKPSNIIVTPSTEPGAPDVVKVVDFGLAKELGNAFLTAPSATVDPQAAVGTLVYMSPEQAIPPRGGLDTRSDIFSLGVILFELLTGRVPIEIEELQEVQRTGGLAAVVKLIATKERPRPSAVVSPGTSAADRRGAARGIAPADLRRLLADELDWPVKKALELPPDWRFANVTDLAAEIRRYLSDEPLATRPPTVVYRTRKMLRRHRRPVAVAAGVVAFLLILVVGSLVRRHLTSAETLRAARDQHEAFLVERRRVDQLESALRSHAQREARTRPPWAYEREYEMWREADRARAQAGLLASSAEIGAQQALRQAPGWSWVGRDAVALLVSIQSSLFDEALRRGPIYNEAADFRERMDRWRTRGAAGGHAVSETFEVSTHPPGADVWVFRYHHLCERWVPVPWRPGDEDPAVQLARIGTESQFLRVDRVWDPSRCPLREGDRVTSVAGRPVRTEKELAQVLEGVCRSLFPEPDPDGGAPPADLAAASPERDRRTARVEVAVVGRDATIPWTVEFERPGAVRPGDPAGIHPFYRKLGVTFEAYPIELSDAARAGRTPDGSSLRIELPLGSYLLVLSREGSSPVRYPVVNPCADEDHRVHIDLDEAVGLPQGYVHVPAGPAATGGDPEAFQPLPWARTPVATFAIARYEVSMEEWKLFVNDPATLARTDEEGFLTPQAPETLSILAEFDDALLVRVVPTDEYDEPRWGRDEQGRWAVGKAWLRLPAQQVSLLAAHEFVAWRNQVAEREGEAWRYRLPTDLEWERAARGVDRRPFVWGDYMIWTCCSSARGNRGFDTGATEPGAFPTDESVFGVRDMAGSNSEHTGARAFELTPFAEDNLRYRTYRGGSWDSDDEYFFRCGTRNGLLPEEAHSFLGLRLVAVRAPNGRAVR